MEINIFGEHQIFVRKNPSIPDRRKVFTYEQIIGNPIAYDELLTVAHKRWIWQVLIYKPENDTVIPAWISRLSWTPQLIDSNKYYWMHEKPWTYADLHETYLIVWNPSLKQDL